MTNLLRAACDNYGWATRWRVLGDVAVAVRKPKGPEGPRGDPLAPHGAVLRPALCPGCAAGAGWSRVYTAKGC